MKLNPRVKAVQPEPDFRLRLTFSNGEVRMYDVGPLIGQGGVFDELRDASAFCSVHPWHGTVQGGPVGLIFDGRGRPLVWPETSAERIAQVRDWFGRLGVLGEHGGSDG